ncbi:uncharacterized protein LOC124204720 [Daphnia pulex]|uniref:uncharacterized protein LOC124204720 n=1 Tax=Daphnia pulex TaxID=6669 RepID=UPI001EDCDD75|nr:uncharacterized protein LOC124204720 [Daphnia pulex]
MSSTCCCLAVAIIMNNNECRFCLCSTIHQLGSLYYFIIMVNSIPKIQVKWFTSFSPLSNPLYPCVHPFECYGCIHDDTLSLIPPEVTFTTFLRNGTLGNAGLYFLGLMDLSDSWKLLLQ